MTEHRRRPIESAPGMPGTAPHRQPLCNVLQAAPGYVAAAIRWLFSSANALSKLNRLDPTLQP